MIDEDLFINLDEAEVDDLGVSFSEPEHQHHQHLNQNHLLHDQLEGSQRELENGILNVEWK